MDRQFPGYGIGCKSPAEIGLCHSNVGPIIDIINSDPAAGDNEHGDNAIFIRCLFTLGGLYVFTCIFTAHVYFEGKVQIFWYGICIAERMGYRFLNDQVSIGVHSIQEQVDQGGGSCGNIGKGRSDPYGQYQNSTQQQSKFRYTASG